MTRRVKAQPRRQSGPTRCVGSSSPAGLRLVSVLFPVDGDRAGGVNASPIGRLGLLELVLKIDARLTGRTPPALDRILYLVNAGGHAGADRVQTVLEMARCITDASSATSLNLLARSRSSS